MFYLKDVLKEDDSSRGVYDLFSKNSKRGYEDKKLLSGGLLDFLLLSLFVKNH